MYGHPIDLVPDFKVLYWGPQVVWGFITIMYLCHVYCFITIVRGTAHCTVLEAECFRGIDSPRLGICCRLQPLTQTLSPSRSLLTSLRVYSKGWPPEIFLNPVIALS